jgi:hypothetical protein
VRNNSLGLAPPPLTLCRRLARFFVDRPPVLLLLLLLLLLLFLVFGGVLVLFGIIVAVARRNGRQRRRVLEVRQVRAAHDVRRPEQALLLQRLVLLRLPLDDVIIDIVVVDAQRVRARDGIAGQRAQALQRGDNVVGRHASALGKIFAKKKHKRMLGTHDILRNQCCYCHRLGGSRKGYI